MADHSADAAIIHGVVGSHIKERWLQDRCGKDDLVVRRVVVRIDGLRSHAPAGAVDRLAESRHHVVVLERTRTHRVADQITSADLELRVVFGFVGIADLHRELRELGLGRRLGRRAHPLETVDPDGIGIDQILDQRIHAHLRLGGKVLFDIELSRRIREYALSGTDRSLPTGLLRLQTTQRAAVVVEACVHERRRQLIRARIEHSRFQILTPRTDRCRAQQRVDGVDVVGLPHDDVGRFVESRGLEIRAPVERRRHCREFRHRHLVVRRVAIAALHAIPLLRCDRRLERQHALRGARGIRLLR